MPKLKVKTLMTTTTTTMSAIGKLFLILLCFSSSLSFHVTYFPLATTTATSLAPHHFVLAIIVFLNVFTDHVCPMSAGRGDNGEVSGGVCQQLDTCACRLSNGSGIISLRGVAFYNGNPRFVIRESEGISLAYNPCVAFTLKPSLGLLKEEKAETGHKIETNSCINAAVCKFPTSGAGSSLRYKNLGQPDSAEFNFDKKENKLFIKYISSDFLFTTTVYLACNNIDELSITKETNDSLILNLETVCACPNGCYFPTMITFSPGTYILIVFTLLLLSYLILGILYNKIVHSAEGIELIPNRERWTSFFSLVKDGYLFFISPCLGNTVEYRYYQQL